MKTYSQNAEDLFISHYFGSYKGTMFDVGSNDGITFSNSKLFIDNGWDCHCFEPGSVYDKLFELHKENSRVRLNNYGLASKSQTVTFWESENHVPYGNDTCLVSTTYFEETKRWPNVKFHQKEIRLIGFDEYYKSIGKPVIDFISIDIEGGELDLLTAIDLKKAGCKCVCIEYNSKPELLKTFTDYCYGKYGMKLSHQNAENLIYTL